LKEALTISIKLAGKSYLEEFCGPTSFLPSAPNSYWGENAAEKEGKGTAAPTRSYLNFLFAEHFLHDLNELRCVIGWVSQSPG
jgi:hypothetical protein